MAEYIEREAAEEVFRNAKWNTVDFHTVSCSACGFSLDIMKNDAYTLNHMYYCPNCGAKMEVVNA